MVSFARSRCDRSPLYTVHSTLPPLCRDLRRNCNLQTSFSSRSTSQQAQQAHERHNRPAPHEPADIEPELSYRGTKLRGFEQQLKRADQTKHTNMRASLLEWTSRAAVEQCTKNTTKLSESSRKNKGAITRQLGDCEDQASSGDLCSSSARNQARTVDSLQPWQMCRFRDVLPKPANFGDTEGHKREQNRSRKQRRRGLGGRWGRSSDVTTVCIDRAINHGDRGGAVTVVNVKNRQESNKKKKRRSQYHVTSLMTLSPDRTDRFLCSKTFRANSK